MVGQPTNTISGKVTIPNEAQAKNALNDLGETITKGILQQLNVANKRPTSTTLQLATIKTDDLIILGMVDVYIGYWSGNNSSGRNTKKCVQITRNKEGPISLQVGEEDEEIDLVMQSMMIARNPLLQFQDEDEMSSSILVRTLLPILLATTLVEVLPTDVVPATTDSLKSHQHKDDMKALGTKPYIHRIYIRENFQQVGNP